MRLLIFGTGVIGSLYASLFAEAGFDTTVYARGARLETLKKKGLLYLKREKVTKANVSVLSELKDNVLDATLTPKIIQPTTFAEISGMRTDRVRRLYLILKQSSISYQIVKDMHIWQLCHLAMVFLLQMHIMKWITLQEPAMNTRLCIRRQKL